MAQLRQARSLFLCLFRTSPVGGRQLKRPVHGPRIRTGHGKMKASHFLPYFFLSIPFHYFLQYFQSGFHFITIYSKYNGHVYSGHLDVVATFPSTKYIYSIIFRSDMVANRI